MNRTRRGVLPGFGLSTGITLYAPALIVSVLLGWNLHVTNVVIGLLVIVYTASGGTKAVSWTHVHQLLIALGGMAIALIIAVRMLPHDVGLLWARGSNPRASVEPCRRRRERSGSGSRRGLSPR